MRWWTILAAAALALTVAGAADARPRFGPGTILRALPGPFAAMFGGARSRHVRRVRTERRSPPARVVLARDEQTVAQGGGGAGQARVKTRASAGSGRCSGRPPSTTCSHMPPVSTAPERGSGATAMATSWPGCSRDPATGQPAPEASAAAESCGAAAPASGADRWIERVEQALAPTAEQRPALEQLRGALAEAGDRIRATCRSAVPTAPLRSAAGDAGPNVGDARCGADPACSARAARGSAHRRAEGALERRRPRAHHGRGAPRDRGARGRNGADVAVRRCR